MDFFKRRDLEICNTPWKQFRGLMFSKRRNLLFDLKKETRLGASVHMFFVFYPIDIYWLDKNKKLVDQRRLKPFRIATPKEKAQYIVEIAIIEEKEIDLMLKEFTKKLPKFPDGRINYTNSDKAPVLTCFVKFKDKILILKRSKKVRTYQGKWNVVAGYLDEPKPIRKKVLEELKEELGIKKNNIIKIKIGASYKFFDPNIKMTWLVYPILIELKKIPKIKIDWEHTEYKWIDPKDISKYDIVPKLDESLKRILI